LENILQLAAKAGYHIPTIQFASLIDPRRGASGSMGNRLPQYRIDHPNEASAGGQIISDFFLKYLRQLVRRHRFNREVGRKRNVSCRHSSVDQSLGTDKRPVRFAKETRSMWEAPKTNVAWQCDANSSRIAV